MSEINKLTELLHVSAQSRENYVAKRGEALVAIKAACSIAESAYNRARKVADCGLLAADAAEEADQNAKILLDDLAVLTEVRAIVLYLWNRTWEHLPHVLTEAEGHAAFLGAEQGLLAHLEQQLLREIAVKALAGKPEGT